MKAIATSLVAALIGVSSAAAPVPLLRVEELVKASDVIAIGTVLAIADLGPISVSVPGSVVPGRQMLATLTTDRVLKGRAGSSLEFKIDVPDSTIGYGSVAVADYRVFFLKGTSEPYVLSNPYNPSLAAVRGPSPKARADLDECWNA